MKDEKQEKKPFKKSKMQKIMPLRDHIVKCNEHFYDIKKGQEIEVHSMFLEVLKTEKVIK